MGPKNSSELTENNIPAEIIKYFTPGEQLLFKIRSLIYKRVSRILKYSLIGIVLSFISFYSSYLIFSESNSFLSLLIILIHCGAIAFVIIAWYSIPIKNIELFLTDKRLYLLVKQERSEWIIPKELSSIRGLSFERTKPFYDNFKNIGKIKIISGGISEENTLIIEEAPIDLVPEISHCQKMMESILYEYGDIKARWESITTQPEFQFPYKIPISKTALTYISQRYKRQVLYMALATIIIFSIAFLLYLLLPPIAAHPTMQLVTKLLIIIVSLIFLSVFLIWYPIERHVMKNRTSLISSTSTLTLYPHQINLFNKESSIKIPITSDLSLDILRIQKPFIPTQKLNEYDGIKFLSPHLSNNELFFGPIDNFVSSFELLFCFLINWKREQNLLLSKQDLIKTVPLLPLHELTSFDKKDVPAEGIQSYLEPTEELLLKFNPATNSKKYLIWFAVGFAALLIGFIFPMLDFVKNSPNSWTFLILLILLGIGGLILATFQIAYVFENLYHRQFLYYFTNRRIILMKGRKCIAKIPYSNIRALSPNRKYALYSTAPGSLYSIELRLQNPLKVSAFIRGFTIKIPKIPIKNNLADRLRTIIIDAKKKFPEDVISELDKRRVNEFFAKRLMLYYLLSVLIVFIPYIIYYFFESLHYTTILEYGGSNFAFTFFFVIWILYDWHRKAYFNELDVKRDEISNSKKATKELQWTGQSSFEVIQKKYFYALSGIWASSFFIVFISDIIRSDSKSFIMLNILIVSMSTCLILILFGYLEIKAAKKRRYLIDNFKISSFNGTQTKELSLKKISKHTITKNFFDVSEFKTGSISFYENTNDKATMKFEHIKDVYTISQMIKQARLDGEGEY